MSKPAKSGEPTTMPVELPPEVLAGSPSDARLLEAEQALSYARAGDIQRMRSLLREVQWSGPTVQLPTHRRVGTCPICREHQTHAAGCRLQAEIA